jgi:hypothetical protein
VKAGQEPAPPDCGGGVLAGGDTGEYEPATVVMSSTRNPSGLRRNDGAMRLGSTESTLLGPEGTTRPAPVDGVGASGPKGSGRGCFFGARHDLALIPCRQDRPRWGWCWLWLVGVVGLWVGRWLRIAQWTRASCFLWLSCQGRTVDALAPGADEGRGRPR